MRFYVSAWTTSGWSLNASAMLYNASTAITTLLTVAAVAVIALLCIPLLPLYLLMSLGIESSRAFK